MELDSVAPGLVLKCSPVGCGEVPGFVETGLSSWDSGLGRQVGELGLGSRSLRACFPKCSHDGCGEEAGFVEKGRQAKTLHVSMRFYVHIHTPTHNIVAHAAAHIMMICFHHNSK